MKRIIVNENANQQDSAINKIGLLSQAINARITKLKNDTGFTLSIEDVSKFIRSPNEEAIGRVHIKLTAFLDSELDKLNVTSKLMRDNFKQGSKEVVTNLAADLYKLSIHPGTEYLHNLTIDNDQVNLSKDAEKKLRESFRNVIESETAEQLWILQKEAAEKLQSFWRFIHKNTIIQYYTLPSMVNVLFELNTDTGEIKAAELDYERITKPKAA